ncbi:unnamed protein product [Clonostachys rosea f. rosea IK726]|uniref:Cytochrome P450 n=2 Tax=Bionectria ochroleuca TaxID=29856 RepID=A0A0B7KM50_BIOOC|nr:unnamed protein product [Clonostachys rosea f. rosea IK726]
MLSTPNLIAISVACVSLALAFVLIRFCLATLRPKGYPPGPPTVLGLGNLSQIPLKQPFIQFGKWSKTYGDILGLKLGPSNLVILHNPQTVHQLFSKRAAHYSGRPYSYIPNEHVFCQHADKHIVYLQNTPYLRKWRAAAAYLIGTSGLKQVVPMQEATAATLAKQLLNTTPSETLDYLKQWALATPLLAIAGQRLEERGKAFSDRFFKAQKLWLELLEPGNAPPVDMVPMLRWIPERFASWKTDARYVRDYMFEEYASYLESAQKLSGKGGVATPGQNKPTRFRCLMTKILEDGLEEEKDKSGKLGFSSDQLAYLGGGLLDAAVDTTWASMMSLVLYLAAYPDVQQKAYVEVTRISPDQSPGGDGLGDLPYIGACLAEILRLCPPTPSGLPHILDRDDIVDGYRIPKGTAVLANVWSMQRNPDDYDQPDEFIPERYLNHPLGLRKGADDTHKRATYTFGAGRRLCPGEAFAQNAIIIAIAKLLWSFKIEPAGPLDLNYETGFHTGLVMGPEPYKVNFVLRDPKRRDDILRDYDVCQTVLAGFGL